MYIILLSHLGSSSAYLKLILQEQVFSGSLPGPPVQLKLCQASSGKISLQLPSQRVSVWYDICYA